MNAHTSFDLLAHFGDHSEASATRVLPTRGVGWVLKWAAAIAVLFVAASILADFGYCLAAEHALSRAARAGAREATLPRATYRSVSESVERRLRIYSLSPGQLKLVVEQNGLSVRGRYEARDGDQFSVTVSLPAAAVVPSWWQSALVWHGESHIQARAENRMPGRELKISARH